MKRTMESIALYTLKLVKEKEVLYVTGIPITSPKSVYEMIENVFELSCETVEKFGFMALNTKNMIVGLHIISVGTLNSALVHPREVFKAAILNNAASIICFHNHPSGNCEPSAEDCLMTKRLMEAGVILGVEIMDHIIIGEDCFCSLRERGEM